MRSKPSHSHRAWTAARALIRPSPVTCSRTPLPWRRPCSPAGSSLAGEGTAHWPLSAPPGPWAHPGHAHAAAPTQSPGGRCARQPRIRATTCSCSRTTSLEARGGVQGAGGDNRGGSTHVLRLLSGVTTLLSQHGCGVGTASPACLPSQSVATSASASIAPHRDPSRRNASSRGRHHRRGGSARAAEQGNIDHNSCCSI